MSDYLVDLSEEVKPKKLESLALISIESTPRGGVNRLMLIKCGNVNQLKEVVQTVNSNQEVKSDSL